MCGNGRRDVWRKWRIKQQTDWADTISDPIVPAECADGCSLVRLHSSQLRVYTMEYPTDFIGLLHQLP
jgi:hypothetical protein